MHAFLKNGKTNSAIENTQIPQVQQEKKRATPQPWVEKYRPKSVNDVVEQEEVVQIFRQCLEGADLPNMLLYGNPGTGKTSTILAAARELFGDLFKDRVLELNASDERGIAVVRQKVKNFAHQTANSVRTDGKQCPPFKIIILDEADAMTNPAQSALRRTMEKESRTTRFCLICNYVSRIIAPITSRCTKFRFKPLGHDKVIERLQMICQNENVQIDDEALDCIVDISGGDMRRAITTLQSAYRLKGADIILTKPIILDISGVIPLEYLDKFFSICKSARYTELVEFIKGMFREAFAFGQLLEQLNEFFINNSELSNSQKSLVCEKLGECSYRIHDGASEYLQVLDLSCVLIMIFLKK